MVRKRTMFRFSLISIGLCLINITASNSQEIKFRHLTTDDGLPSNVCLSVISDAYGFIWIATRGGLCRYDGYTMKVFQYDPADTNSISDNSMGGNQCMVVDHDGNLWASTYRCINKYNAVTGEFQRYKFDSTGSGKINSDWIYCLYVDGSGTLWAGTGAQGGLNRYSGDEDKFIAYSNGLSEAGKKIPSIFSIYEDHLGILWIGTAGGLYQFNRDEKSFIPLKYAPKYNDPNNPILYKFIGEDTDGTLFIGTQFGYLTYDRTNNKLDPFLPLYDEKEFIPSLYILSDPGIDQNMLWMIAWQLHQFNRQIRHLTPIKYMLGNSLVSTTGLHNSIFKDNSGIIWLSTESGLNILDPKQNQIRNFHEFPGYPFDAKSFYEDHKGHIWIGSTCLMEFDAGMNLVKKYDLPSDKSDLKSVNYIIRIFQDSEMNIWLGTDVQGIFVLEKDMDHVAACIQSPMDIVVTYDIYEDERGYVWFATDLGLFQHNKGTNPLTGFFSDPAWKVLNKMGILCIREDGAGNLWLGTNFNGLFCLPQDKRGTSDFIHYNHDPSDKNSISNDMVWTIYEDINDNLWIGTEHGLNKFIPGEDIFQRYINETDPGSNCIYDLTGDTKGNLWITSEIGLIRFKPDEINYGGKPAGRLKHFLSSDEIFPYRIFKDESGRLFVGTPYGSMKGYFSFHPDSIRNNMHIPPVVIGNFKIHNLPVTTDTNITIKKHYVLKHNQNFFSLEFAALDYARPEKNQYAYFLEGLENNWNYCGQNRTASYTKVPPGNYAFHVKGSNHDGYWNETGASIAITILPPPWRTWWAYLLYAVAFILTIYLVIRFYLTRLKLAHKIETEHLEAEKLKELDRMKSRFFANISHEFRTPLTLILGPIDKIKTRVNDEFRQDLDIMQRNARRLQRLIDQLLSLSRLESGQLKLHAKEENLVSLVNGYIQLFESLAKQKEIELTFKSDQDKITAFVDHDKIEKVLFNLLSNAFKFTDKGGKIEVSVDSRKSLVDSKLTPDQRPTTNDLTENDIILSVRDTGIGITHEQLPHIFDIFYQADDSDSRLQEGSGIGLALTRELVELHHGTIRVESEPSGGTTFYIYLPSGKDHLLPEEIALESTPLKEHATAGHEWIIESTPVSQDLEHQTLKSTGPIVLMVDDNADLRIFIRGCLEKYFHVIEATDGETGLQKTLETIPDLVISDVMMPGMDGFELCKRLKTDERSSHIPVILLTARAAAESKIEGLETGADDYIIKPFDAQELIIRIKNLIRQRNELRNHYRKELEYQFHLSESVPQDMDQKFLRKARRIVEENLTASDFTSELFAARMALSRVQLHRKLKALVDQSASEFIRTIRLNKAAEMLSGRAGTISEIAYDVGFNTLPYFTKCFREQFGMNPSEFIARQRSK